MLLHVVGHWCPTHLPMKMELCASAKLCDEFADSPNEELVLIYASLEVCSFLQRYVSVPSPICIYQGEEALHSACRRRPCQQLTVGAPTVGIAAGCALLCALLSWACNERAFGLIFLCYAPWACLLLHKQECAMFASGHVLTESCAVHLVQGWTGFPRLMYG